MSVIKAICFDLDRLGNLSRNCQNLGKHQNEYERQKFERATWQACITRK